MAEGSVMKKYEFQVMVTEEDGKPPTLLDRCTVTADSYPAAVYLFGALFDGSPSAPEHHFQREQ